MDLNKLLEIGIFVLIRQSSHMDLIKVQANRVCIREVRVMLWFF